ncbi:cytochrome c oxidase subunit 12, mitochondrial-like [Bombus pyrosoma]|uniref:cytochrome c oxidase subunit 12, mitochondrial-like n=1 Tax=Bombus pyrosoma TaxID=396416 RepID=UPI001CB8A757|nr:cytochrome c oxidase subunit 12, mitochondrial-like [Bombus pyrosoma]
MDSDKNNKNNKINISDETKTTSQKRDEDNTYDTNDTNLMIDNIATDERKPKKKITITVDEDDPCLKQEDKKRHVRSVFPGEDPRFQQQNQTLRCWVMYHDFYRCERTLGEGSDVCTWFKQVFTSICPREWISRWDELRVKDKLI